MDVRNAIVENLKKHKEIEKVISVFVDSRCRIFFDIDGKRFTQLHQNLKKRLKTRYSEIPYLTNATCVEQSQSKVSA